MGLLSWLFPKPADKIAKARKLMDQDRHAEARLAVIDVDHDDARAIVAEAEEALVEINLEKAIQRCRAGDEQQVEHHLKLAEQFHHGGKEERFEAVRTTLAELRQDSAKGEVWDDLAASAERRRKLGDDPGDFARQALTGQGEVRLLFDRRAPFGLPGVDLEPRSTEFVPPWVPPSATSDRATVLAAIKDAWPAELHPHIDAAGDTLVSAMIAQAELRPEAAVKALMAMPTDNPVARFELGRAAAALGCHTAAVLALQQARKAVEASFSVGDLPLRVFGARCMRWAGAIGPAWQTMDDLSDEDRAYDPYLYIALAIETANFDQADAAIEELADDDIAGSRLDAVMNLRRSLIEAVEAQPDFTEEKAGSAAYEKAAAVIAEQLTAEAQHVLGSLRDIEIEAGVEASVQA